MTHPAHCKVGQKRSTAADFHQFSEDDEGEDEVEYDLQNQSGNAVIVVIQVVYSFGRLVDRGFEHAWKIVANKSIEE